MNNSATHKLYTIEDVSYTAHQQRITYFRIRRSSDAGRTWYGECNFASLKQAETYLFGLAERGRMLVKSFEHGNVIQTAEGHWTFTAIINGLEQRPGSAGTYRRSGQALVAMRQDVALAQKQHNVQPVSQNVNPT